MWKGATVSGPLPSAVSDLPQSPRFGYGATFVGDRDVTPIPRQRAAAAGVPSLTATVVLVDPDQATRETLRRALVDVGVGRVLHASSLDEVNELIDANEVGELALVSLQLGRQADGVIALLRSAGWSRVLALAPTAEIGPVIDAVGAGVSGVLIGRRVSPSARSVPSSIHELSSREIEVLRLVADGRSNKWIGQELALSSLTVKSHLARIGRKLGTGDRAHMVALAMRAGVIG